MTYAVCDDQFLPPHERQEILLYLGSHIEWEHVALDVVERFGADYLDDLDDTAIEWLAVHYGYFDEGD